MESRLLKSAILRLNNTLRPYPSLFYFPGIDSAPFWNPDEFNAVKILESNYNTIKEEYMLASSKGLVLENDYKLSDHEKHLHKGNWEWYSYISKGLKQENFKNMKWDPKRDIGPKKIRSINLDNLFFQITKTSQAR